MKIAFLIHSWFPHGGQQRDMMRLVRECLARGHDLTVHAMRWRGPRPDGLRVNLIEASALGRLSRYRRYAEQVRRALAADPVEFVVGFNKMPLLDAYFAADPCFAEIAQNQRPAWYRDTPRFRHFSAREQSVFGAESKTAVLLLTARQRDEYLRHYPDSAERLHLLPPGLAEERKVAARDPQARRRLRRELAIAERQTLILQVGSGFRIKGVDRSLRAFASLPERLASDCRFVLVGSDRPVRFRRLARRLGVSDRFTVLPGQDDVASLYQAADLLLHPAYVESAGHVLLEATVAGLPVLTTATCGYASHIIKAGSGEVCGEPFSQRELDARLLDMLTRLEHAPWQQNGLRYGRDDSLCQMPSAAIDLLEQLATPNITPREIE